MQFDALQMVQELDRRIAKLQEIRRLIIEEFGNVEVHEAPRHATLPNSSGTEGRKSRNQNPERASTTGNLFAAIGKGRKHEIFDWLKVNGPASRAEIIKGTGFPPGTVGFNLSKDPDLFESREGKWHAKGKGS